MKILLALALTMASTQAFASTATDRQMQAKADKLISMIYQDEITGETCAYNIAEDMVQKSGLLACNAEQIKKIEAIDAKSKNPEVAAVGAILVEIGLAYYSLCTIVQVAPYAVEKYQDATDSRTKGEKIKDIFAPGDNQRERNAVLKTVKDIAADAKATVCKPIANMNEKIYYFFAEER